MSKRFRNLARVDDLDLLDRIREIEGPDFCDDSFGGQCRSALDDWRQWRLDRDENLSSLEERSWTGITIYGAGGWNRYQVHGDGVVAFSTGHASKDDIEKAKRLGFQVGPR